MLASAAPMLTGIPYIGWLAAGWATLLGQNVGKTVGAEAAELLVVADIHNYFTIYCAR